MSIEDKIKKSEWLVETIGKFPTFHDSEVEQLVVHRGEGLPPRSPYLLAKIFVLKWLGKKESEERDSWCHYLVELRFSDIDDLSLRGFNQQNVLSDLCVEELPATESKSMRYEVVFEYCHGVEAIFTCSEIIVEAVGTAELIKSKPVDEQTLQERQRFIEEHLRRVRRNKSEPNRN